MRARVIFTSLILVVLVTLSGSTFAGATRPVVEQVCPGHDSGKIDTPGAGATLTITAPDGFLISHYCVKAGSAVQGDGPEMYDVDPPAASVTISHSSGKNISHYSVSYVPIEEEEPVEVEAFVHFKDSTCESPGPEIHLGNQDQVDYLLHGKIEPGAFVEVMAFAKDGYVLVGQDHWEHTFAEIPANCQPPDDDEPTPDAPPVEPETPAGGSSSTFSHHNQPHHNELPHTL